VRCVADTRLRAPGVSVHALSGAGQAATLTDQSKRKDLYEQAEVVLVKDAAYIPLYHTASPYLIKPWIDGWVWQAVGGVKWKNLRILQH